MKRIFSGMQPTNQLHLGNYLGALQNWVKLQTEGDECIYCIVDLHAVTAVYDTGQLAQASREVAAAYIAAGLDPEKSIIFVQSAVPAHTQLMWLFSTLAQLGELNRMTQFKEKSGNHREKSSLGLYGYPVLQAADILLYKGTHVPVGEDQRQHLELSREIARTFNFRFDVEFFPEPEPIILGEAARVMSLRNGNEKMSKSAQSDMTRINLTDDADTIALKFKKAKTDPDPLPGEPDGLAERPEATNLVIIYGALVGKTVEEVIAEHAGKSFSEFKGVLTDVAISRLGPMAERMRELLADTAELDRILGEGAARAAGLAEPILAEVTAHMGFWRPPQG